jgi:hypothetical protein
MTSSAEEPTMGICAAAPHRRCRRCQPEQIDGTNSAFLVFLVAENKEEMRNVACTGAFSCFSSTGMSAATSLPRCFGGLPRPCRPVCGSSFSPSLPIVFASSWSSAEAPPVRGWKCGTSSTLSLSNSCANPCVNRPLVH